ncbi:hypothetical protein O3G_MSEX004909 [Manduca sexta]|uniref:Uncharacterized protein n=1 Tax=Manduca sexta TaxID=7130 RepID=A0A922CHT5_MANSE|nr:hypothetical protein O3G_MSEX004909 [Manduca sexta]
MCALEVAELILDAISLVGSAYIAGTLKHVMPLNNSNVTAQDQARWKRLSRKLKDGSYRLNFTY